MDSMELAKRLYFIITLYIICGTVHVWSQTTLNIYALSNIINGSGDAVSIIGAQWIASQEINNNSDLLDGFEIHFHALDVATDTDLALIEAIKITELQHNRQNKSYNLPIILGCPWSSLSAAVAPVLNAFNIGLISASATSISLSDTDRYPYFYRTVPSDALQSQGLILLCQTFNWTRIGAIYVNDAYGLNLALGIQTLGAANNIEVKPIAISESHDASYDAAAKQIKDLQLYIIIVIVHDPELLFNEFKNIGLMQYPYYYLGTDAWFDKNLIQTSNLTHDTRGFIATIPFVPDVNIDLNDFNDDKRNVVNDSIHKMQNVLRLWEYYYQIGNRAELYTPLSKISKTTFMLYGYDAMYTIAYALQELIESGEYGDFITLLSNNSNQLTQILNDIIINNIDFNGTTGHVTFDENGDRIDGLYSYANAKENGTIEIIGYFYKDINGQIISEINMDKIWFPDYFTAKQMIPQSEILTRTQIVHVDNYIWWIISVLSVISFIFSLILIIILMYCHKNTVIRAASWKLNCVMCIGGVLGSVCAIVYTIDEGFISNKHTLDFLCNIRLWLFSISFTIVFMPLFMKTYRLSRVFNILLHKSEREMDDKKLFIIVSLCVFVDIILLILFAVVKHRTRVYENGPIETIDVLQNIQYLYGRCSFDTNSYINILFYGLLILWKGFEMTFGLHVTLIVSRIKDVTRLLGKFDETGIQLLSIYATFIVLCIVCPVFIFVSAKTPNFYCLLISGPIIFTGNIVISLNLLPRIIAVCKGNEHKYKQSAIKRIQNKLKEQFSTNVSHIHLEIPTSQPKRNVIPSSSNTQLIITCDRGTNTDFVNDKQRTNGLEIETADLIFESTDDFLKHSHSNFGKYQQENKHMLEAEIFDLNPNVSTKL